MRQAKASSLTKKWKSSPIATLLFLLAAAGILYGCALLVRNVARNSLQQRDMLSAPSPTLSASPAPSDSAHIVSAIRTPKPSASPTPESGDTTPSPSITPPPSPSAPTPSPTPKHTPLPVVNAAALSPERANLLLVGMDASSHPDWIAVVRIEGKTCRILSVPKNTLHSANRQLADAGSVKSCANQLERIWPIRYPIRVSVTLDGLVAFVDQFGGVQIEGRTLDGAGVADYLANGPSDELLRIERQQAFMRAYIERLQSVGMLALLSSRFTLERYVDSNLGAVETLTLLELIRRVELDGVSFHTLPVDSVLMDGARRYLPDTRLVNIMAADWSK